MSEFLKLFAFLSVCIGCTMHETKVGMSPDELDNHNSIEFAHGFSLQRAGDSICHIHLYSNPLSKDQRTEKILWKFPKIERIGCLSTTHIPYLKALNCENMIVAAGFSQCNHFPEMSNSIMRGDIVNVARDGSLDKELLLASAPEIFFTYPFGGNNCKDLLESGIGCVPVTEYLEDHPLGRSEWIKLFGILLDRSFAADSIFEGIKNRYNRICKTSHDSKPLVFFGTFDGEAYYAPPGNSFIAQFIRDAGAEYYFEETKTSSNIRLDKEQMIEIASKVEFMGTVEFDKNEWATNVPTSRDLAHPPILFSCDAAEKDYYGRALLEPDVLLRDFITIFHENSFRSDSLKYFRVCEANH